MLRFLCCGDGQTQSSPDPHMKGANPTTEHQEDSNDEYETSQFIERKRSFSVSAVKPKPTKSREDDKSASTSVSDQGILKGSLTVNDNDSSESLYVTAPSSRHPSTTVRPLTSSRHPSTTIRPLISSRHPSTSSHPLNKVKKLTDLSSSTSSQSQLNQKSAAPAMSYEAVLHKMEVAERKIQKQHEELLKVVTGLSEKIDKSKSDGLQIQESVADRAPLPPKSPVCPNVILELSKRVSKPQWKFLARRLKIPDHEIDKIEANYRENIQEQSYQMLRQWIQSNGGGSYQELGEALRTEFGEQLYSDFVKIVSESEEK